MTYEPSQLLHIPWTPTDPCPYRDDTLDYEDFARGLDIVAPTERAPSTTDIAPTQFYCVPEEETEHASTDIDEDTTDIEEEISAQDTQLKAELAHISDEMAAARSHQHAAPQQLSAAIKRNIEDEIAIHTQFAASQSQDAAYDHGSPKWVKAQREAWYHIEAATKAQVVQAQGLWRRDRLLGVQTRSPQEQEDHAKLILEDVRMRKQSWFNDIADAHMRWESQKAKDPFRKSTLHLYQKENARIHPARPNPLYLPLQPRTRGNPSIRRPPWPHGHMSIIMYVHIDVCVPLPHPHPVVKQDAVFKPSIQFRSAGQIKSICCRSATNTNQYTCIYISQGQLKTWLASSAGGGRRPRD